MSNMSPAAHHIIDIGSPGWCWSQLGSAGEGLLSWESQLGRMSLAVPYVVVDRQISICLAQFNTAGWSAAGQTSRLEVSGVTGDDLRWVVRATGTPERSRQRGLAYSRRSHPSNPATTAPEPTNRLLLLFPRVRGFYETSITGR